MSQVVFPQRGPHILVRAISFLVVGWWAWAAWMALAWLVQWTIIGIPIALLMFNRTPFRRVALPLLRLVKEGRVA